jgi:putative glutathione S-transferase
MECKRFTDGVLWHLIACKQIPGIASTCDLEAIMDGYYRILFPLNPGSIIPAIPRSSQPATLLLPHGRERLSKVISQVG